MKKGSCYERNEIVWLGNEAIDFGVVYGPPYEELCKIKFLATTIQDYAKLPYTNSLKLFIIGIFIRYNEELKGGMMLRKRISSSASIACVHTACLFHTFIIPSTWQKVQVFKSWKIKM